MAMTSLEAANWHPVTWLSHLLDVSLFGLNPHGHHATSLLLHTLNVVLLFLWLRSMTGALWKSPSWPRFLPSIHWDWNRWPGLPSARMSCRHCLCCWRSGRTWLCAQARGTALFAGRALVCSRADGEAHDRHAAVCFPPAGLLATSSPGFGAAACRSRKLVANPSPIIAGKFNA